MAANVPSSNSPSPSAPAPASVVGISRPIWLLVVGICISSIVSLELGDQLWFPVVGIGLAFTSWLGLRFPIALTLALVVLRILMWGLQRGAFPAYPLATDVILGAQLAAAWWLFFRIAEASPRFDNPRSAALFLILIPGVVAALAGAADLVAAVTLAENVGGWMQYFEKRWISLMLGYLVAGPFCLVILTPLVEDYDFLPGPKSRIATRVLWSVGEFIELTGLAFGNSLLSAFQVRAHFRAINESLADAWPLWGISLLMVVWSSLRQGVRGGTVTAFAGSAVALIIANSLAMTPESLSPLQGNFLAQCAIAVLVGSAVGWIRATEARYRHVVGHIPLVLTSVRLQHPVGSVSSGVPDAANAATKPDPRRGRSILNEAEIVLVSNAAATVLGTNPESLIGPFSLWLDNVHPEDRDIVTASIMQLGIERKTVVCEYRIVKPGGPLPRSTEIVVPGSGPSGPTGSANGISNGVSNGVSNGSPNGVEPPPARWVRDTIAPHYTAHGQLDGWDSVVEEITEQRALQQNNRRIAGMLQALVANMPTGVFFVQGPGGQPILVNARARQLLGQREDLAAGLVHLSQVYRLHRQDGTEYPMEDLPVAKALRYGQTCTANDIVVHRPDGRRVPLFTWAAPIDLGKLGRPEAAVWVLEDLSALQQAEFARRETEARLRAVFETLAEGVIVQNKVGIIIEGNPAAAAMLGFTIDKLVGRSWLGPDRGCLRDDGTFMPSDEHPDRLAMQIKMPVRNVIVGLPREMSDKGEIRWVMVNSMPLPVGTAFTPNTKGAALVTTFADITQEREAQRIVFATKERYQSLVETLPVMVVQLDQGGAVAFMNPAAREFVGASPSEFTTPGQFYELFEPADRPRVALAIQDTAVGKESRFEFGLKSRGGEPKIGLALVYPQRQDGRISGSTWIVVDMTRQRRLEEELVKSQRLELVGRLASGTVHDFNNFMTTVIGTAGFLKMESGDRPELAKSLGEIEQSAIKASQLVEQIMSLGKNPSRPSAPLDVNDVVRATLGVVRRVLPESIQVQTMLADEPLPLEADDLQIKQAVLNLCLNARDAMPNGGTLAVSTRLDNRRGEHWIVICIDDTGTGMTPQVRERMFDPFFTTKDRAAGVGLSVVKEIIQRLGGTIDVWTEPAKGTHIEIGVRKNDE